MIPPNVSGVETLINWKKPNNKKAPSDDPGGVFFFYCRFLCNASKIPYNAPDASGDNLPVQPTRARLTAF